MNQNALALITRIPERYPAARKAAESALNTAAEFSRRHDEMKRSGTYTQSGVAAAIRGSLPATLKQIGLARSSAEKMKRESQTKRAALRPVDLPKDNSVAAMNLAEIRAFYRTLPPAELTVLLMRTSDKRLLEAALLAPPELTLGVNPDRNIVEKIEARYAELVNPTAIADAAEIDQVADELTAIVDVALGSLRQTADLDQREFEREVQKSVGKVWLVGDAGRERVCEVAADGQATYRAPTPQELEAGVRYANLAEYLAA